MSSGYDVLIIGAGCFGMSAGYHMAKSGLRVLLIDADDPPHENGSHHGETRLFRSAYTMGPAYVALALRSRELWLKLAEEARELGSSDEETNIPGSGSNEIFRQTGVVSIGAAGSDFLRTKLQSCQDFHIPHQTLGPAELMTKWPGFSVPDNAEGLFEPEAGILFCENIIRTYRTLAINHGAKLLTHTSVLSVESAPGGCQKVTTTQGSFEADRVLVTAGAWSAEVLPELKERVRPFRKTIGWFEAPESYYGADSFPAFVINNGGNEEYYGFPNINGAGLKVGRHDGGEQAAPGTALAPFGSRPDDEQELLPFLDAYLPKVSDLKRGSVCLYENAPGERFLIGPVPERPGVWFAGGGSGHGFKFGSAVGEALSELFINGRSRTDFSEFQF